MEDKFCIGCGMTIQTVNKNEPGFIPESAYVKHMDDEAMYCQRCFRIKNYQDVMVNNLTNDDYLQILNNIGDVDALIVMIVDTFDFSGSFLPQIKRLTGNNDLLLVCNKMDILPKNVNQNKIMNWIKHMIKEEGLDICDSILISAKKGDNVEALMDLIFKYKKNRDVYFVGASNVGKSKLINQVLKRFTGTDKEVLTVSNVPGTTLGLVGFPLDDGTYLYDTPGVINRHQYFQYLTRKSLKMILPQKEIKPLVFQLDAEQTLFVGGLARFDFLSGEKSSKNNISTYFSNKLNIHRTKLSNAENLYSTKLYSLLTPPFSSAEALPKMKVTEFKARDGAKYDIVISGLGFISLRGPFHIKAWAPVMVGVYIRDAII